MGREEMSCCGALTRVYADQGKRKHNLGCPTQVNKTVSLTVGIEYGPLGVPQCVRCRRDLQGGVCWSCLVR